MERIHFHLKSKCINLKNRFVFFINQWPVYWSRLFKHFGLLIQINNKQNLTAHYNEYFKWRLFIWVAEFFIYFTDILGLSLLYETFDEWINFRTRNLLPSEITILTGIFGDQLNVQLILIDSKSRLFARKYKIAYVTFNTINHWGIISDDLLVHEAAHCWQYQQHGSVYWFRAILAQFTKSGYDYGNLSTLIQNNSISGLYNYEQQAEIITDYYKMSKGQVPTYHKGELALLAAYKENLLS